ncbi:uncharacterized protein TM35_000192830 [Trypanosoma theileri]|uniref:Uncharacterized protein n=1 Tax=Trypanosoma theileri TaxID=67003 RepID=A0A1X0NV12_9TRYP|nr:uncharacterized protein TM35_000192830 [Trypanosoma theileri]ORC88039.1 hypothetical protein TM35_000192830 [Trypanosoma theileri]
MKRCSLYFFRTDRGKKSEWLDSSLRTTQMQTEAIPDSGTLMLRAPFFYTDQQRICTTQELLHQISMFYCPDIYAYSILSARTILSEAHKRGILETTVNPGKFFVHPAALIRNPSMFSHFFGISRSPHFSELLSGLLASHDAHHSVLVRVCHSSGVDTTKWIAFLRGLCLCIAVGDPLISQVTYVMEDLLLGSGAHDVLTIPGEYHERGIFLAELLLEAGVEFGLISVLQLSLSIHQQFFTETPYAVSKRVAVCFTRSERRFLDWNLRCLNGKWWK